MIGARRGREAQLKLDTQRRWSDAGGGRIGGASVTRVGVDLTERACRPLIRLSTRRMAAARAVRVSEPRPSTSSFSSWVRCQSGAYAGPPAGARRAARQRRVGAPVWKRWLTSGRAELDRRMQTTAPAGRR
ncbi:hypothetical protein EVAR_51708_1 [Eumeta japonica]|uniref:Uncharacterized protein n=1 Tax=Eumeta variegata TaxID=151549 RepID=A0A4C1XFV9_EUMVA|nr:hypothetical protein EVAR_51708_1 [Eumeta japonica]